MTSSLAARSASRPKAKPRAGDPLPNIRRCQADLDGIWNYIADRAGAETAGRLIWKFDQTFASIAMSPRAGVNCPDLPPGGVRKFPMGNYLIYYRMLPGKILISRVLHGKRAQRRAFRQRP